MTAEISVLKKKKKWSRNQLDGKGGEKVKLYDKNIEQKYRVRNTEKYRGKKCEFIGTI